MKQIPMVMRVMSDEINTNGREGHECVPKQYRLNKKKNQSQEHILIRDKSIAVENEDQIYTRLQKLNNVESCIISREENIEYQI